MEFAILAPLMFTMLFGVLEMGRMFYVRQALEYATEQAARYYMLNPTTASSSVTTYLQGQMAGGMGSNVTVAYTNCSNASVSCSGIKATYTFNFVAAFLGLSSITMNAKAQAVLE